MAMSVEHRSNFAALAAAMVTIPYEWKILDWDDKLQTNKQKIKYVYSMKKVTGSKNI